MSQNFKYLRIEQLDKELRRYRGFSDSARPPRGWIRTIREALGMTAEQLARRVGVSRPTIVTLERSEARNTITLESLEKLARGLGCRVVYAIVPQDARSLDKLRRAQALKAARRQLAQVSHTMKLEAQGLAAREEQRQLQRLVDELLSGSPRKLWQ